MRIEPAKRPTALSPASRAQRACLYGFPGAYAQSRVRETYQQISGGKKSRKKIAIVAVARRLLVRCWAMLRDGTSWRAPVPCIS